MAHQVAKFRASSTLRFTLWCTILSVLTLLLACGPSDTSAFEKARHEGTAEAYETFIKDFPKSSLIDVAKTALETTRYAEAKKTNTVQGWKAFLEKHPNSKHSADAKYGIEYIEFKATKKENTKEAYQKFLKKFPAGTFSHAAQLKIDALVAAEATPEEEDKKDTK